ncbi:MAG: NADH-quinone oxidoreductase subunit K [Bacteroidota bacterium]
MENLIAIVVGLLVAISIYLMLRRSLVRLVIGLIMLSNAANLSIFAMGRMSRENPPFVAEGAYAPPEVIANPLSQALILTAIVIGFGLMAFSLALVYRTEREHRTTDSDALREDPLV